MTSLSTFPRCIYRGFDGLDVSFCAALPDSALDALQLARSGAEETSRPKTVAIGPGSFGLEVAETGARGGYRFRGDSGRLGGIWFFKNRLPLEPGNIRVSVHSETLAILGLPRTKEILAENLHAMGALVSAESIGRVDFAIDFALPSCFRLEPNLICCHSRFTVREAASALNGSSRDIGAITWKGRRATSITIGKMPGRQIIIYDKRAEAIARSKLHWFKIWNIEPSDNSIGIWRIEIRFGKSYLSERAKLFTYLDLDGLIQDEILKALESIRYLSEEPGRENVSRIRNHLLWEMAKEEVRNGIKKDEIKIAPNEFIESVRLLKLDRRRRLVGSLLPGIVSLEGYSPEEGRQIAGRIALECALALSESKPELFLKRAAEVQQKLNLKPWKTTQ